MVILCILPKDVERFELAAIKITPNLCLDSLFSSLRPFLESVTEHSQEFLDMKCVEALGCLFRIDDSFYSTLFDFNEEWTIDLLKFMEDHFAGDM